MYIPATVRQQNKQVELELNYRVNNVINHPQTVQRSIEDWPKVKSFLNETFPDTDIISVRIYEASPRVMGLNGFEACGGCYVGTIDVVLIKNKVVVRGKGNGQFAKMINSVISSDLAIEDVVVHELLHAVSYRVRGVATARNHWGGLKYKVAEEEFVYTNCIPFYLSKGMSETEVVDSIILPFCLEDVYSDRGFLVQMLEGLGLSCNMSSHLMDSHAASIVPIIVKEAKKRAFQMVDLYNKYGCTMLHGDVKPNYDPGLRVAVLDPYDCIET